MPASPTDTAPAPLILIIDDEEQIRRLLRITLEASNYRVCEAANGKDGITQAAMMRPELVLLDMGLPDVEGADVLRSLRGWSAVPVIVLSVRNGEQVQAMMLDAGADDYVTKPFSSVELLARVRVALRHAARNSREQVQMSVLRWRQNDVSGTETAVEIVVEIDVAGRVVRKNGEIIKLTGTEFGILRLLANNAGRVLTHKQILREVWGASYGDATHYVHVQIAALRRKLEVNPSRPKLILTESGVGYRLRSAEE
jgi:two-component system, OmpR family, KDP operon response regulator KdpE